MKLESSKSRLNNQKKKQIKGKSAKFASVFIRNKANFVNPEICVIPFQTSRYEILPARRSKKQTQFKPNSNPISEKLKINANIYHTKEYNNKTFFPAPKTNPNKPITNPIQACPRVCPLAFLPGIYPQISLSGGKSQLGFVAEKPVRKPLNLRIFELTKRMKKVIIKVSKTIFRGLKLTENSRYRMKIFLMVVRKILMMKLSFSKLTLTFIGLSTVLSTLCFAKAQAPRVRAGTPAARTKPVRQSPAVAKPAEAPPVIVASIGDYDITKKELQERMMREIHPNSYGNYNEEPEPVSTEKVLLKMIAEKAVISEARKGDYLKEESMASLIQRYKDRNLVNLLLQKQLQPKLMVTEPEIQQRMKADPKLTRERAEAMIRNIKARMLFSQYYNYIYQKFHAKKLTENFPKVVQIRRRLLTEPKKPRTGAFIRIAQIKEELTQEEKDMVLVTFDKGKVTLKDWFDSLTEMSPPSRPKNLDTVKGVEQLLDRALSKPLLLAEALHLGLDKDKDFLQKVKEYEDDRLLSKVRTDKYREVKQPTAEEIMLYFGKNQEVFRKDKKLKIDLIWCQDLKTARQAKAELDGGKDFEAIKQKYSLEKKIKPFNTYPGGEGLFWKDLWKGDPNDVIGPTKGFYRSGVNWRIVKILEKSPGELVGYSSDMDNRIKEKMMGEQREAIFEKYCSELLKKYTYQIYADKIKDIDPLDIP